MTIEHKSDLIGQEPRLSLADQLKNGWKQYSDGDRQGALQSAVALIAAHGNVQSPTEQIRELHALAAWGCYHLQRYEDCLAYCQSSESHPRALECELTLRSYVAQYRDEDLLRELSEKIGDTPAAANAFLIRAISMSEVHYDQVVLVVERFFMQRRVEVDGQVILGHILHNAAKVLIYRSSGEERAVAFGQAERWMREAIDQYQRTDAAPDHLAAAYFHLSQVSDDIVRKRDCLEQCVRAWRLFNNGKAPDSSSFGKQIKAEEELQKLDVSGAQIQ
jgi:hypothetical protein